MQEYDVRFSFLLSFFPRFWDLFGLGVLNRNFLCMYIFFRATYDLRAAEERLLLPASLVWRGHWRAPSGLNFLGNASM